MKVFQLQSLFIVAIVMTLSACEKNAENIKNLSVNKAATTSRVVYPLVGTEISGNILPKRKLPRAVLSKAYDYPNIKVCLIDTVCPSYLQETKKLDFSYLEVGAITSNFGNDDIVIEVDPEYRTNAVAKLSNGPNGWWTHWNYSPYTESEHPIVLFSRYVQGPEVNGMSSLELGLTKFVKTFGFEIAPNATGMDIEVSVTYNGGFSYRDAPYFYVDQIISSPSGARLIAVKSEEPFDYILIDVKDPDPQKGFAIANIRYQLAD
jgi:hypothetical protein